MEYRFRKDTLNDTYRIDFSMGHEAFGSWLNSEVGPDKAAVRALIGRVATIRVHDNTEETLIEGRDFSLTLTRDDAMVRANSLNIDSELPDSDDDLAHYDDESTSACGIDDFDMMLHSWLEFIR